MVYRNDFPGLLVSDPREFYLNDPTSGMPLAMTTTGGDTPLMSSVSPASGGLEQSWRPMNIYNGQQWPVQLGMDAYPSSLKSVLNDNQGAATLAAFGSDWAKYMNDYARQCGGGDSTFDTSNQMIRDANPLAVDAGDKAEKILDTLATRGLSEIPTPLVLGGLLAETPALCK